jgi:hypothetical protein
LKLRPEDFSQPVLKALRNDIIKTIVRHELDCRSVIAVVADVMGHCLGTAKNKNQLDESIRHVNAIITEVSREIYNEKSSMLIVARNE